MTGVLLCVPRVRDVLAANIFRLNMYVFIYRYVCIIITI